MMLTDSNDKAFRVIYRRAASTLVQCIRCDCLQTNKNAASSIDVDDGRLRVDICLAAE